jgi:glycopeptide antibiotics resistance protein
MFSCPNSYAYMKLQYNIIFYSNIYYITSVLCMNAFLWNVKNFLIRNYKSVHFVCIESCNKYERRIEDVF